MDRINLQYLAGLMDGEGTFSIIHFTDKRSGTKQYRAFISIGMTNKNFVELLKKELGGTLGTFQAKMEHAKRCYKIIWNKQERMREMLLGLIPHLILKREQAELLLLFVESRMEKIKNDSSHRSCQYDNYEISLYGRIISLNKKGI